MSDADEFVEQECRRRALELDPDVLASDPGEAVDRIVRGVAPLLEPNQRDVLRTRVLDRLFGLGPLEPLLAEPGVTEIMVNGPGPIWVEQGGRTFATPTKIDRPTIDHLVERIVAPLSRRLDRTSPVVDGRLPDGSRVHVVAPPIAIDGPYITIRRFETVQVSLD
ncbi:MAG: ATPase, T2SS/T4P/T4SS family, partial [Acidimicrobiales bacterium]